MAFEVVKGLASEGWEIHLGYHRKGIWSERYKVFAKKFHPIPEAVPSLARPWKLLQSTSRIRKVMQGEGIRILFSSHLGYLTSAALMEKISGIRSCFHLGLMGAVANTISGRWAVRQISAGVTPSTRSAKSWKRVGWPKGTLHVVPNWIDWEEYLDLPSKEQARKMLGIGTAAPARRGLGASPAGEREGAGGRRLKVVAYVGRLVEEKGIEVLLEAWNQGFALDEDAVLLIAGTGKPEYEAKLKAKAAGNIKFLGGLPDTKPVYRASDLTVVPSLVEEVFGLIPIEAVACGSLPLVSDKGFLPEIVGEKNSHLIHRHGDVKGLQLQLQKYLGTNHDELRRELRNRCEKNFSKELGLRSYQETLTALL